MLQFYILLALATSLPLFTAQRFRPGAGGPGVGVDCVLEVNSLFPAIAKTIVDSQKLQRECADCQTNGVLADGNSTRDFSGWEGAKQSLEKECAEHNAEICMASVSIMNLDTSRRFLMNNYAPTCKPKACNTNDFGFMRALRRFSRNKPSNLFWYPPAQSDPVIDECNQSNNCVFVFDFCGVEMRMGYDSNAIENFSSALASSVAQSSTKVVGDGMVDKNEAKDDTSKTQANKEEGSSLSTGALIGIIAGAIVVVLAIVVVVRSKTPTLEEFN